jgi:hypothetical protein
MSKKLDELSGELSKLREQRWQLIKARDNAIEEIEKLRSKAAEMVLSGSGVSKLADEVYRLEFGIEANFKAVELLDGKMARASALFEAAKREREAAEREAAEKLEREQALYR